jgi:hypothetical protein
MAEYLRERKVRMRDVNGASVRHGIRAIEQKKGPVCDRKSSIVNKRFIYELAIFISIREIKGYKCLT